MKEAFGWKFRRKTGGYEENEDNCIRGDSKYFTVIKSTGMRWAGHVTPIGRIAN